MHIDPAMLASVYRLNRSGIKKVKALGKMVQDEDFGVLVVKREDNEPSRFGFLVSTNISKLAVHRNRITRAMHEAVRYNLSLVAKNYDMVFLVKRSIEKKATDEIMKQVEKFLKSKKYEKV